MEILALFDWNQGHKADISCVDFVGEGADIVSGGCDNTVRVWNCATQKQVHQLGALGPIYSDSF